MCRSSTPCRGRSKGGSAARRRAGCRRPGSCCGRRPSCPTASGIASGWRSRWAVAPANEGRAAFLVADEFSAVLDRTLAKVLAFNVRKLATRTGVGLLLATTHDDLIDDLNPDLHVRCLGDGDVRKSSARPVKKKRSASPTSFGCRTAPSPTGRTSLGGITAATTSPSSAASSCSGTATSRSASASSAPRPRPDAAAVTSACTAAVAGAPRRAQQQLWLLGPRGPAPDLPRGRHRGRRSSAGRVETCPVPWVETLSAMGQGQPVLRAGRVRSRRRDPRRGTAGGTAAVRRPGRPTCSRETAAKSRFSEPVYYVFDNRRR